MRERNGVKVYGPWRNRFRYGEVTLLYYSDLLGPHILRVPVQYTLVKRNVDSFCPLIMHFKVSRWYAVTGIRVCQYISVAHKTSF